MVELIGFGLYFARMVLEFTKLNGAGDDFELVNNRAPANRLTAEPIIHGSIPEIPLWWT